MSRILDFGQLFHAYFNDNKVLNRSIGEILHEYIPEEYRIIFLKEIDRLKSIVEKKKFRLCVLGEMKSGKSTVINALFGKLIAPSEEIPCTSHVISYVYSEKPFIQFDHEDPVYYKELTIEIIRYKLHTDPDHRGLVVSGVTIGLDIAVLEYLTIEDFPGFNESEQLDSNIFESVKGCDVILYVLNGDTGGLHISDIYVLRTLADKPIFFLTNKADKKYNAMRQIVKTKLQDNSLLPKNNEEAELKYEASSAVKVLSDILKEKNSRWKSWERFQYKLYNFFYYQIEHDNLLMNEVYVELLKKYNRIQGHEYFDPKIFDRYSIQCEENIKLCSLEREILASRIENNKHRWIETLWEHLKNIHKSRGSALDRATELIIRESEEVSGITPRLTDIDYTKAVSAFITLSDIILHNRDLIETSIRFVFKTRLNVKHTLDHLQLVFTDYEFKTFAGKFIKLLFRKFYDNEIANNPNLEGQIELIVNLIFDWIENQIWESVERFKLGISKLMKFMVQTHKSLVMFSCEATRFQYMEQPEDITLKSIDEALGTYVKSKEYCSSHEIQYTPEGAFERLSVDEVTDWILSSEFYENFSDFQNFNGEDMVALSVEDISSILLIDEERAKKFYISMREI